MWAWITTRAPAGHAPDARDRVVVPPTALALGFALTLAPLVYRVFLALRIAQDSGDPGPSLLPALRFELGGALADAALALLLAGLAAAAHRAFGTRAPVLRALAWLGCVLALAALGIVWRAHIRVATSLHVGLGWPVLAETFAEGSLGAIAFEHLQVDDVGWFSVPLLAFGAGRALSTRAPRLALAVVSVALGAMGIFGTLPAGGSSVAFAPELSASPVWLLATSAATSEPIDEPAPAPAPPPRAERRELDSPEEAGPPPDDQRRGMRLDDPTFAAPGAYAPAPGLPAKKWNVVWIVMESSSTFFIDSADGARPMPFFDSLAKKGLYLAHHRSPSNSSGTSVFSQMSGLYPLPSIRMFSTEPNNHIPGLFRFLGPSYDAFFVTPTKLTFFFPQAFLRHSGLTDLVGYDELPFPTIAPASGAISKDERATVDFFLDRLDRAKPPFAAVYYSYVAHWPYTDYGPETHVVGKSGKVDPYMSNLRLLDQSIRRIVERLEASGRLDDTILVFAGDHGEAWGQHVQNYAHSRGSFEENVRTPALFVQPRLFSPRVVDAPTSHPDLVPTLLDALGVPYEARLFQGESLLRGPPRRKYLFGWGNEGSITSLSTSGVKVILRRKTCQAYDLGSDPGEAHALPCERHAEQSDALRRWQKEQLALLPAYNAAVKAGEPFDGLSHP